MEIIRNSQHFVYIENQFFITATVDNQKPITNKIASAIVERIIRAARNGEKYKMIVVIPAIPGFAGDLKTDEALSTRAIMEFQYDSINRGGHSIYESIARAGYNPMDYIRFYNLRNYDRINASGAMHQAEKQSGVSYAEARDQHDAAVGGVYEGAKAQQYQGYTPPGETHYTPPPAATPHSPSPVATYYTPLPLETQYPPPPGGTQYPPVAPPKAYDMDGGYIPPPPQTRPAAYQQYQQEGAVKVGGPMGSGRWDSVAECYMLGGEDIRNVPWEGGGMDEIDAFVSEELYVHSKVSLPSEFSNRDHH
jgi:phospholipase D1/2